MNAYLFIPFIQRATIVFTVCSASTSGIFLDSYVDQLM